MLRSLRPLGPCLNGNPKAFPYSKHAGPATLDFEKAIIFQQLINFTARSHPTQAPLLPRDYICTINPLSDGSGGPKKIFAVALLGRRDLKINPGY